MRYGSCLLLLATATTLGISHVVVTPRDVIQCFNEHAMYKKTRVEQLLRDITRIYAEAFQELENFKPSQCAPNKYLGGSSEPVSYRVIYNGTVQENAFAAMMQVLPQTIALQQNTEVPCARYRRSSGPACSHLMDSQTQRKSILAYRAHIGQLTSCLQQAHNLSLACQEESLRYNELPLII